jgi:hypothetical protein
MDFLEIELFSKNKEDQSCLVIERSSNKLDLVYGSYYPQPDQDIITVKEKLFLAKGSTLAYIEDGTCRLFELLDIKISDMEPREDDYIQIPFVALVKGLESEPTNIFCISAFLRFEDMIIKDNILNRYGIYAIHSIGTPLKLKDTVIHENEWLGNDTWTELIDWNLLTIIEPEDREYYHHTDHTAIIEELKYTDNVNVEEISTFEFRRNYFSRKRRISLFYNT